MSNYLYPPTTSLEDALRLYRTASASSDSTDSHSSLHPHEFGADLSILGSPWDDDAEMFDAPSSNYNVIPSLSPKSMQQQPLYAFDRFVKPASTSHCWDDESVASEPDFADTLLADNARIAFSGRVSMVPFGSVNTAPLLVKPQHYDMFQQLPGDLSLQAVDSNMLPFASVPTASPATPTNTQALLQTLPTPDLLADLNEPQAPAACEVDVPLVVAPGAEALTETEPVEQPVSSDMPEDAVSESPSAFTSTPAAPKARRGRRKGAASKKRFQCSYCSRYFVSNSVLIRHVRVHTGEKPFLCSHCGQGFKQMGTLTSHIRIHTGETPFTCETCGMKFRHRGSLNRHGKRVHK